jgi:hypothetical protein
MATAGPGSDFGPCADWPVHLICDVSAESPVLTGLAVSLATDLLWGLTGMRFGLCDVTLRPCRRDCYGAFPEGVVPFSGQYPRPALIGGQWFNLGCGGCPGTCSCSSVSEFVLPSPVHRIVEIKIDGTPMPTGSYRLDNNRIVIRTDGGLWPLCNDLGSDDTEPGTWSVTATFGEVIPEGAALAMGALVCEIIRAGQGADCNLPPGLTQLIRQGVTIQYPDIGELLRQGRTGIWLVDAFVNTWNPSNLRARSRVYNVDRPTVRRPDTGAPP